MSEKPRVRVNKHGLVSDGFANVVAGIGAAGSKTSHAFYTLAQDANQADAAFRTSTWYGKILTIPADDAVKEWRKWKATREQIEKIEHEEKRLRYRHVVHKALLVSRQEGGALIVPGGLPGANSSPLDYEQITEGSIKFFHVLSKDEVNPGPIDRSPLSENYGRPEWWETRNAGSGATVRLHHSRVIPINGRHVPGSEVRRGVYWGDSIWMHLADAVIAADSGHAIISALMHEAKIDVVSVPGLAQNMVSPEGEQAMVRRWEVAARLKSLSGIMLIDGGPDTENAKEEKWNQKQIRWDGLSDVMRTLLTILSGAADIPYTRLTGDQQKGLSNNDEGSMRNYYSSVNTEQVLRIEPMLLPMDRMLLRSALGSEDEKIWYTWSPLFMVSDRERAEQEKMEAETVEAYQRTAMLPDEALSVAVQNRMVESGRWPGLEEELRKLPEDWEPGVPNPKADPVEPGPFGSSGGASTAPSSARDAAPRTLYVRRDVLNWREIESWAKRSGVATTLGSDMHVTIAFSRTPIDWMSVPEPWEESVEVKAGGPRLVDRFGASGDAKVLLFRSNVLEWRHETISSAGASWDHPGYQPHITFTYGDVPEDLEPYNGPIVLGPEIFSEVQENWSSKLVEDGL